MDELGSDIFCLGGGGSFGGSTGGYTGELGGLLGDLVRLAEAVEVVDGWQEQLKL
uniref:Uncharacterized protein n=1 Tax=Meloidogyne enterolobii TaxID=390850 RepID=A0A6V7XJ45_MELEN|nr:unnamed protein product [Meloidogyne enterolobii]